MLSKGCSGSLSASSIPPAWCASSPRGQSPEPVATAPCVPSASHNRPRRAVALRSQPPNRGYISRIHFRWSVAGPLLFQQLGGRLRLQNTTCEMGGEAGAAVTIIQTLCLPLAPTPPPCRHPTTENPSATHHVYPPLTHMGHTESVSRSVCKPGRWGAPSQVQHPRMGQIDTGAWSIPGSGTDPKTIPMAARCASNVVLSAKRTAAGE